MYPVKAHACIFSLLFETLHHYRKQRLAVYPEIKAAVVHAPFCYERSLSHGEKLDHFSHRHLLCQLTCFSALFHYHFDISEIVAVPVKQARSGLFYDLSRIKI